MKHALLGFENNGTNVHQLYMYWNCKAHHLACSAIKNPKSTKNFAMLEDVEFMRFQLEPIALYTRIFTSIGVRVLRTCTALLFMSRLLL